MTVRLERRRERRRIVAALIAALLIHLAILLLALLVLSLVPDSLLAPARQPAPPEPVEIVIVPPPKPSEEQPGFVDSSQGEVTDEAPKNAKFESDQNLKAGSEGPAESDAPIPTTQGQEDLPDMALRNQELSLGPSRQAAPPSPPPVPPQPQSEQTEKTEEAEKPEEEPGPTPKPEDAELAMLDPSRPRQQQPEPEVRKPETPRPPSPPTTPGYQPQTRVTRLKGGITNRGRASVEAMATPLGRYKKMLSDAIGSRWYYYVNDMMDLVSIGTVELRFVVRADGTIEGVKVLRNTSNESLASCSVRAVIEAEIPPMPKDVADALQGSRLEIDYSFTIVGGRR